MIDSYAVQYGAEDSGETSPSTVPASQTSFAHLTAEGDTSYWYQARSVNSAGNSFWTRRWTPCGSSHHSADQRIHRH